MLLFLALGVAAQLLGVGAGHADERDALTAHGLHAETVAFDLERLAGAYGLPFRRLHCNREAEELLPEILAESGPVVIEVMTDPFEVLGPKAATRQLPGGKLVSAPLEDLAPFLPREEFRHNMLIDPVKEDF